MTTNRRELTPKRHIEPALLSSPDLSRTNATPPVGAIAEAQQAKPFRLSPQGILEAKKPLDVVLEKNTSHLYGLQTQLGAYLVLGNGIALFTLVQAAAAGHTVATGWFEPVYLRFVLGLGVAFFSMVITYFFGLFGSYILQTLSMIYLTIADADTQASASSDPAQKQLARTAGHNALSQLAAKQKWAVWMQVCMGLITAIYLVAGIVFIWGLVGALHLTIAA